MIQKIKKITKVFTRARVHKNARRFCAKVFVMILVFTFTLAGQINIAQAVFNKQINYQGKLTNTSNVAVSDGTYHMNFNLYTAASGGSPVWTEDRSTAAGDRITVTNGLFSVMLGSSTAFTGVDFNQTLYLGVEVGGSSGSPSWDGEMTPRKVLGAVPAAFVADTVDNLSSEQFLRSDAVNATSTSGTFFTATQNGAGKIAEFFGPSSASVLSILSGGNVGIGTTTPNWKLSVAGNGSFDGFARASYFTATSSTASTFPYASTTALTVSGTNGLQLATGLDGPLQANAGLVSATSSIGAVYGGTGLTSITQGDIIYGSASNVYSALTKSGTANSFLKNSGTSNNPAWSTISSTDLSNSSNIVLLTGSQTITGTKTFSSGTFSALFTGGNVGIGTTSPFAVLSVQGPTSTSGDATTTLAVYGGAGKSGAPAGTNGGGIILVGGNGGSSSSVSGGNGGAFTFTAGSGGTGGIDDVGGNGGSITLNPGAAGASGGGGAGTVGNIILANLQGNVGIGTTSPWRKFSVNGSSDLGINALAGYFTATTSTASVFPYASTTALTVSGTGYFGTASTTNLTISGTANCSGSNTLNTSATGVVSCGAITGFSTSAYPFTTLTNFGVTTSATSTPIWAQGGIYASSTSQFVNASTTLLTVSGDQYLGGNLSFTNAGGSTISNLLSSLTVSGESGLYLDSGSAGDLISMTGSVDINSGSGDISLTPGSGNTTVNGTAIFTGAVSLPNPDELNLAGGNTLTVSGSSGRVIRLSADSSGSYFTGINLGLGTTTPQWLLNPYSSTAAQLSLSAGAGVGQWAFRNAGGNLYFASTTVAGTATTSSAAALTIIGATGNTGIATTSPWGLFSVNASGLATDVPQFVVGSSTATNFIVTNAGSVGVGTTTSSGTDKLSINGGNLLIRAQTPQFVLLDTAITDSSFGMRSQLGTASFFRANNDSSLSAYLIAFDLANARTGIATTTPSFALTSFSTSASQLSLSAGAGIGQWAFRNAGGNLYFASTTIAGTATTSSEAALTIIGATGNTGIATTSPWGLFSVNASGLAAGVPQFVVGSSTATNFMVANSGNVGIGTTSPYSALSIGVSATTTIANTLDIGNGKATASILKMGVSNSSGYFTELVNQYDSNNPFYIKVNNKGVLLASKNVGVAETGASTNATGVVAGYYGVAFTTLNTDGGASSGSQTRLAITMYGNVGVGSTSPYARLAVVGSSTDATNAFIVADSNSARKFVVQNNGNVGVGTTTPWRTFSVDGTVTLKNLTSGHTGNSLCIAASGDLVNDGTNCTASALRFKQNIQDLVAGNVFSEIMKLRAVSFDYKDGFHDPNEGAGSYGLIAEEVEKVDPLLVDYCNSGEVCSLHFEKFVGLFLKAIQELNNRVTALEAAIQTQNANLAGQIGANISSAFAQFKKLVSETLTVGSREKPTGITLYDEVTGNPYCLSVANGNTKSTAGECGSVTGNGTDGNTGGGGDGNGGSGGGNDGSGGGDDSGKTVEDLGEQSVNVSADDTQSSTISSDTTEVASEGTN